MHHSHNIPEALKKAMNDSAHLRPVLMDDAELGSITGGYAEDPAHDDIWNGYFIYNQTIAYFYFYEDGNEKFNAALVTGMSDGKYTLRRCETSLPDVTVPASVWPRQILWLGGTYNA